MNLKRYLFLHGFLLENYLGTGLKVDGSTFYLESKIRYKFIYIHEHKGKENKKYWSIYYDERIGLVDYFKESELIELLDLVLEEFSIEEKERSSNR